MAELDFSWRCEENRTDELGTLAHSLNEMSQKLSASMTELKCANERLQADIERERALEQAQLDFFPQFLTNWKHLLQLSRDRPRAWFWMLGIIKIVINTWCALWKSSIQWKIWYRKFSRFPVWNRQKLGLKRNYSVFGYSQTGIRTVWRFDYPKRCRLEWKYFSRFECYWG